MKWNEDKTEVTLTKAEFDEQETKGKGAADQFNKGYGKGAESGREEILKKIEPFGIDIKNLEGSLKAKMQLVTDIESGKYPKEFTDKFKETEVFKDLQTKLQNTSTQLETTKTDFANFQKSTLIDSRLKALATDSKAVNADVVANLVKMEYGIEIGENNKITIKNAAGTPMFNDKGEELALEDVFKTFSEKNKYLFEANGSGGSGGGGGSDFSGVTLKDLQKDSEKRSKFIKEHGEKAYMELVDKHDFIKKE